MRAVIVFPDGQVFAVRCSCSTPHSRRGAHPAKPIAECSCELHPHEGHRGFLDEDGTITIERLEVPA